MKAAACTEVEQRHTFGSGRCLEAHQSAVSKQAGNCLSSMGYSGHNNQLVTNNLGIVTAAYFSRVSHLLQNILKPLINIDINPLNPKIQNIKIYLSSQNISCRSSGNKLLKYEANSFCVTLSLILTTTLFYKALIFDANHSKALKD